MTDRIFLNQILLSFFFFFLMKYILIEPDLFTERQIDKTNPVICYFDLIFHYSGLILLLLKPSAFLFDLNISLS